MDFKIGDVVRKRSNKPFKDCSKTALVVGFYTSPNPKGGVGLVLENNTVVDSRMLVKDDRLTDLVRKIKETVAKAEENDCDEFSADYINDMMPVSSVFLTKKEAMQAVYNRLNTENQRPVDLWEIQNYNQKCFIFDLPQIPINITARTTQIDHVKADLQSKELQLLALTHTINGLKESLKRLEELT